MLAQECSSAFDMFIVLLHSNMTGAAVRATMAAMMDEERQSILAAMQDAERMQCSCLVCQLQAQLLHRALNIAKRRDDCLMGNAAEVLQVKSDSNHKKTGKGQWLTCEPHYCY